jgi:hypothetical protein
MGNLPIGNQLQLGRKVASLDAKYGPYNSLNDAQHALGENGMDVIAVGLTVGIIEEGKVVEYWWQGGTDVAHLVKKVDTTRFVDLKDATINSSIPYRATECQFTYDGDAVYVVPCVYEGANCTLVHAHVVKNLTTVNRVYLISGKSVIGMWGYAERPAWVDRYIPVVVADKVDDLCERLKWK